MFYSPVDTIGLPNKKQSSKNDSPGCCRLKHTPTAPGVDYNPHTDNLNNHSSKALQEPTATTVLCCQPNIQSG